MILSDRHIPPFITRVFAGGSKRQMITFFSLLQTISKAFGHFGLNFATDNERKFRPSDSPSFKRENTPEVFLECSPKSKVSYLLLTSG